MNWLKRATVVAATVGAVTLAVAAPASAHVTVSSTNAVQGGYGVLTFRVPTESDTASTTKVEINLPADAPVASASTQPIPGWTIAVVKAKLATPIKTDDGELTESVSKITFTASADAAVKPGQFQQFDISAGPLPKVDQMVFKALQTYSDGTVVRWIDAPTTDGTEPESPAPVLKLAAAAAAEGGATTTAAPTNTQAVAPDSSSDSSTGTTLGIAGLALGVIALIIALLAYRRAGATATAGAPATDAKERVSSGKSS
ncbi:YcnI family protein [Actinoplanes sp. NPDC051633]|uniref:YcnI family copper-binding membrane protein n=1 Tax=Actinoplanes sp. NPDC051633 TaxID=3155670 RepID=UPI00341CCA6C